MKKQLTKIFKFYQVFTLCALIALVFELIAGYK